jgi:putative ABC transport system permease protein
MIVFRMAMRELWRARIRLALLAIVLALQVMTIGGTYVGTHSFNVSRDEYYRTLHFADLEVKFTPAADNEMPSLDTLRKVSGVRAVARRFVTHGTIEDQAGTPWPVVVVYLDPGPQEVNSIAVLDGRGLDPKQAAGALIDASFAETRHVKVGDPLVVNPHRFATRFTIAGIGMSPEHLAPAVDPRFLLPTKGSLGIVYAPRAQLDGVFVDRLYNDLLFVYEPGFEPERARANITAALKGLSLEEIIPQRSNMGYRLFEELLRTPRVLTPILALVVGLLGAIVAYVLMMRIISSQRREIGALLAIGFPAWHFIAGYLLVGLAPGIIGAGLGMRLAPFFGRVNALTQAHIIGLPEPQIVIPYVKLVGSAAFAVAITLVGVIVPLFGILRMTPALAMRGGNEVTFRALPRFIEVIVAHGRAPSRYALRNVFRRLRLSGAVVALVCAGVAAPAALLTINSSWELWSAQMAAKMRWDATVNFRVPLTKEELANIIATPGMKQAETFVQGRATLAREGVETQEVRVRGLPAPCLLDTRELTAGRELSSDDALEAILNEGVARDQRPISVGEVVRLISPTGKTIELKVVGLVHDASASVVHVPLRTAQNLLDFGDKVSGMFVVYGSMSDRAAPPPALPDAGPRPESAEVIDLPGAENTPSPGPLPTVDAPEIPIAKDAETALLREEMVLGLQSRAAAVATTDHFVQEQRSAIFPFLTVGMFFACAAILGVLAVLLLERENEYATLRGMGYGRASITRIVFTEFCALSVLGLSAAILGWLGLGAFVMHALSDALFPLPLAYRFGDFLRIAIPTTLCLALAAAAGVRSILAINLREALCTKQIG